MKLFRIEFEKTSPSSPRISVNQNEEILIGIQIKLRGVPSQEDLQVYDDDICLVQEFENDNWHFYKWTVSHDDELRIQDSDSTFFLEVNAFENQQPIEINDPSPTFREIAIGNTTLDEEQLSTLLEGGSVKKKLVFGHRWPDRFLPDWPNGLSAYYNQTDFTHVSPGTQVEGLTSFSMPPGQFVLTRPLSGGTQETLTNASLITCDTLVTDWKKGWTLVNSISSDGKGYPIDCLINRFQNVRIAADGYKINVACFAAGENVGFRDGNRDMLINAGQEVWLSCNSELYNPFQ